MFRLWAKIFKDNRMLKDTVICDATAADKDIFSSPVISFFTEYHCHQMGLHIPDRTSEDS